MKVVHLSCVAPPEIGGIGSVAAKEVSLLRARGVQASLIAPETSSRDVVYPGRQSAFIHRIHPWFRFGHASFLPGIMNELRKADLIHLHYPFFGVAEPVLFHSQALPPIIVTYHMDARASGFKGLVFSLHRLLLQHSLLRRAKAVIYSSFDYAKRSGVRTFFQKHLTREEEIPFGIDTEIFFPGSGNRARYLLPQSSTVYLFVGGLDKAHAFKGVDYLLEAFSHLPENTHLLIVGDGDLKVEYERLADQLQVRSRVHFLGRLDQETLIEVYRTTDVFVFPSINRAEAFGLAALEAEACGKPVIASDLPGVRTVVLQGETGLLIPPKNAERLQQAMLRLHEDKALCLKLGEQARTHAEKFSWDTHIDSLLELYENCRTHE